MWYSAGILILAVCNSARNAIAAMLRLSHQTGAMYLAVAVLLGALFVLQCLLYAQPSRHRPHAHP